MSTQAVHPQPAPPADPGDQGGQSSLRSRWSARIHRVSPAKRRGARAALACSAAALVLVSLHVVAYTEISPIDELPHIDSMIRTSRGEVPRVSGLVGQQALREEACRGLDRGDAIPPCTERRFDPQEFQDLGENTVAWKFPVYHFVTGVIARAVKAVTGFSSLVTAARLVGAAWLAGGLALAWWIMEELQVRPRARLPALALMATVPSVMHASATVNSDATLLVIGAATVLAALKWERSTAPPWVLAAIAFLAAVTETASLVAVAAAGVYLVTRALSVPPGEDVGAAVRLPQLRRKLVVGVALVAFAGAGPFLVQRAHWQIIGETDDIPPYPSEQAIANQHVAEEIQRGSVTADQILREYDALITPVKRPYVPEVLSGSTTTAYNDIANWLLLAGMLGAIAYGERTARLGALALASLVVLLATGPLHAWANARQDLFIATPPRFGLALLPALGVFVAAALRRSAVFWVVSGFVAFGVVNALWRLI